MKLLQGFVNQGLLISIIGLFDALFTSCDERVCVGLIDLNKIVV